MSEETVVPTQPFRQHEIGIDDDLSPWPLLRRLNQEWAALHERDSTAALVRRWGRHESALAGFLRPGDIVDAIDAADHDRKDELLLALIRLAQAGQELAGRTVLQAMLPAINKLGASWRQGADVEERRHLAIAEFWTVLAGYPTDRRPSRVAANLVFDTLHRITQLPPRVLEISFDHTDVDGGTTIGRGATAAWMAKIHRPASTPVAGDSIESPVDELLAPGRTTTGDGTGGAYSLTRDADLVEVIGWGLDRAVLNRDEAQMLIDCYLPARDGGAAVDHTYGYAAAAAKLGVSQAALRQRCSRTARRLTDAVRTDLHIVARSSGVARAA